MAKKNLDEFDVRDVDWSKEEKKWNYIFRDDKDEGYRYATHNIIDTTEPLYHDEWEAYMGLYEYMVACGYKIDFLPTIAEIKWE